MSYDTDYWAGADAARDRTQGAWATLEELGFEFDEGFEFAWRPAAEKFNQRTLGTVFALRPDSKPGAAYHRPWRFLSRRQRRDLPGHR